MLKSVSRLSAVTWLGAIFTIPPTPFIHLVVQSQGWFDPHVLVYYRGIALCGMILAALAEVERFGWARLSALALSVPAACSSLLGVFRLLSVLHPTGILRLGVQPDGIGLFLWTWLAVIVLMICMPALWTLACFQLRHRSTA